MRRIKQIGSVVFCLVMIGLALIMLMVPAFGYKIVGGVLGAGIVIFGAKKIFYYFTMAKNMIGGKRILINGIILLDFGLLAFLLMAESQSLMIIYFTTLYLLYGAINILRCVEIHKQQGIGWQIRLLRGIFCIGVAIACLIFNSSTNLIVLLFSIGLIGIAVGKVITSFTKSQIIIIK